MLPKQLDIYKASAGSGKTHLLTIQYLKLLFAAPYNFRHILAVTFTNKATAEMKSRILEELQKIAKGDSSSSYAQQLLAAMPGKSFDQLQLQAREIFISILHDYSRFAVSTIDSFVQKIIRSFAYEMGMDAGFRLQLNASMVKEALADKLFVLLDTDTELRHWVSDLALGRLQEGKNWNFREEMIELAGEIFKEDFQDFEQALAQVEDIPAAFRALQQKLFGCINAFEKQWQETGEKAMQLVANAGLYVDDFYYKGAGFIGFIKKAADGEIKQPGARVLDVLNDPLKMEGKKFNPVVDGIRDALLHYIELLVDLYNSRSTEYLTAKAINANIGILRLMKVFSDQLGNYRSENNMLLISDTHLFLRQLTRETESSFIFEKTGSRYQHYLIDEFQDTSGFQWDNFKPLVSNSLSEGNYSLLVGDIKQAIYRWRSGNWELLYRKVSEQLHMHQVNPQSLQDNYRSAKAIIEFNNYLYAVAPALLQQAFNEIASAAPQHVQDQMQQAGYFHIIQTAYNESHQLMPQSTKDNGLVDIQFIDESKEEDFREIVLPKLHETITSLLQQGFQPKDIAILTRGNRDAAETVAYLMQAMQQENSILYEIISADALLIKNNPAVMIIINAMECLLSKKGKLSLVTLRQAFANYHSATFDQPAVYLDAETEERILPPLFTNSVESLRMLSLPDMVNEIIRIFDLNKRQQDFAYLLAFQDLVSAWARYGNDGLLAFLQFWEEEGCNSSLPSDQSANAVNILTIHRSKGLAFEIVLLPFLDWETKPGGTKSVQLWMNTMGTPFNDIAVVPVRYKSELANTAFAFQQVTDPITNDSKHQGYFPELLLSMMDNLNLLYVATTRARRRIYGFCPKAAKIENINSIDKLLFRVASNAAGEFIPDHLSIVDKDAYRSVQHNFDNAVNRWLHGNDDFTADKLNAKPLLRLNNLEQTNWKDHLVMRFKPLQTEADESLQLPRTLGILLHEAMALLQHPSQLDSTITSMAQRGLLTESQQTHTKEILEKIIGQPVMQQWATNQLQALKEKDILTVDKKYKRPDLILYNNEKTIVVDFKFTGSEKQIEQYKKQIAEYINLLRQLNFKAVQGILMFVTDEGINSVAMN